MSYKSLDDYFLLTATLTGSFLFKGNNMAIKRLDRVGTHRSQFDKNRKKIYATQTICGICGKPVDFSLKFPDPMSPTIDHIIPVAKGGHPSDIDNLQLAHFYCNRQKSDRLAKVVFIEDKEVSNYDLPLSCDWISYRG